jgi:hypothetical protein
MGEIRKVYKIFVSKLGGISLFRRTGHRWGAT